MSVPNQTNHRAVYAQMKEAGQLVDNSVKRHTGILPTPVPPVPKQREHPLAKEDGSKMTIAERLGMPEVKSPKKAEPLKGLTPPANANVPETAEPEVVVDPDHGVEGDLPPVAELHSDEVVETGYVPAVDENPEPQPVVDDYDVEDDRPLI